MRAFVIALATAGVVAERSLTPSVGLRSSQPHLILILQDDLGHYDVAFNGNINSSDMSSHITALANDGGCSYSLVLPSMMADSERFVS